MTFTVTALGAARCACWIIGFGMGLAALFTDLHLGGLAAFFVVAAAMMTVKSLLDSHAANWSRAYEIGREVQQMRRIR